MDTLLIVEDEKMIRRGIAVMAQRCSVEIREIIECRNGAEALEILKKKKVDTVFTDIRMPKMDGIELVKEIDSLEKRPDVVVISGYDDFNYAVEMLKHGVADYILKPVKREKIEEVLKKLEEKQKSYSRTQNIQKQMLYSQIRCLLSSEVPEEGWGAVNQQWEEWFQGEPYVAVVFSDKRPCGSEGEEGICIEHINGNKAGFILESRYQKWTESGQIKFFGVSLPAIGFKECRKAYEQGIKAREKAFVGGKAFCIYDGEETEKEKKTEEPFADQFVSQFSTSGREGGIKNLLNLCFKARHGEVEPEKIVEIIRQILKKLAETYKNLVSDKTILSYEDPLLWDTLEEYEEYLKEWMRCLENGIAEQFLCDQNKRKIQEAVEYIRENYRKDLNMAMVSNYVSMNYSLFSIAFKNYTGINFVNYLKGIRIKEAKKLLENTNMKIQEVGKMVGYDNDKHFMKIFKSICGISPSEYRKNVEISKNRE